MDPTTKPEGAITRFFPLASLAPFAAESVGRFWDQGTAAIEAVADWNAAFLGFAQTRAAHNAEAFGRMTQCQSLPDLLAAEINWYQCALDDYAREVGKLAEANISLLARATATVGKAGQPRSTTRGALRSAA